MTNKDKTTTPRPDRAAFPDQGWEDWSGVMYKLALYKLPTLFITLLCLAGYIWGVMGIIGVLALTSILAAIGYLFKEL